MGRPRGVKGKGSWIKRPRSRACSLYRPWALGLLAAGAKHLWACCLTGKAYNRYFRLFGMEMGKEFKVAMEEADRINARCDDCQALTSPLPPTPSSGAAFLPCTAGTTRLGILRGPAVSSGFCLNSVPLSRVRGELLSASGTDSDCATRSPGEDEGHRSSEETEIFCCASELYMEIGRSRRP